MKRHRSPDAAGEGSSRAKLAKTPSERTATEDRTDHQLSESHPKLCITVKLRSATKAARNDPKPSSFYEAMYRHIRKSLDTGDLGSGSSSSGAIGDEEDPRRPDPTHDSFEEAYLGLADEQRSAQDRSPADPEPTADPIQASPKGCAHHSNE